MTIVKVREDVARQREQLDDLLSHIAEISDASLLTEVRARIDAARAWAKVHGKVSEIRLSLLRVEVEALIRVVELGGLNLLKPVDRKAAEFLAAMTIKAREAFIAASGNATTATGMCRTHWREQDFQDERASWRRRGMRIATTPEPPTDDSDGVEQARQHAYGVTGTLSRLVEENQNADSFTISELASEVMRDSGLDEEDRSLAEGIREVCRDAVRRAPSLRIGETILPRFVTARVGDDGYRRIPIENALLAHLEDNIELRREQLRQDQAALDRLIDVRERLAGYGASAGTRIGEIIAASLRNKSA